MRVPPPFQPALTRALARLETGLPGDSTAGERLLAEAVRVEGGGLPDPASGLDLSPWRNCPGLAGELFQELQARRDPGAARDGQVFTPWRLSRHVVELLEPDAGQRWLDPAAGAGIFLQAAVAAGVPASSCHALELDPAAAELGRRLLPAARWRLGDALADWSDLPHGWRGGWSRVVLNPPFRNGVERRDPRWEQRRDELRSRFASARGPFDLYVPFVERALDLLEPRGRLGLVLPIGWLASRFGKGLRRLLAARAHLLRVQHAPGVRLFPRADFGILLVVLEPRRDGVDPELRVDRLDSNLGVTATHSCPQELAGRLAEVGWGPLLAPPAARRLGARTLPLGVGHEVRASLSTAEFYQLKVREAHEGQPAAGELRLLSSGSLEPFRHQWPHQTIRFRGCLLLRPVVEAASLSGSRRRQTERHRVLLANLSRRLEAVAVVPGEAIGVVNVMQILCADRDEALALAAWLNSGPLQEWTRCWHDPARLGSQLALSRALVESLPGLPDPARTDGLEARRELVRLAGEAERVARSATVDAQAEAEIQARLDRLVAVWMAPAQDA
jgi:hypothetical protein